MSSFCPNLQSLNKRDYNMINPIPFNEKLINAVLYPLQIDQTFGVCKANIDWWNIARQARVQADRTTKFPSDMKFLVWVLVPPHQI